MVDGRAIIVGFSKGEVFKEHERYNVDRFLQSLDEGCRTQTIMMSKSIEFCKEHTNILLCDLRHSF